MERIRFHCQRLPVHDFVEVWARDGDSFAVPVEFRKDVAPGDLQPEPAFKLRFAEAQGLMDELWAAGLRPTEGSGSAGSLAATERHLEDMRRLVFEKI